MAKKKVDLLKRSFDILKMNTPEYKENDRRKYQSRFQDASRHADG